MTNSIIPAELQSAALAKFDESDFAGATNIVRKFLPRFKFQSSSSKLVKAEKIPNRSYALIEGENVTDLGKKPELYLLAWRPRAIDFDSGEKPINVYDAKSDEFKRIQAQAAVDDSGCSCGPEILVYIPAVKDFALMHLTSWSERLEAKKIFPLIGSAVTMDSRFNEKAKNPYHSPVVVPNSAPIGEPPSPEDMKAQIEKFLNPETEDAGEAVPTEEARPQ